MLNEGRYVGVAPVWTTTEEFLYVDDKKRFAEVNNAALRIATDYRHHCKCMKDLNRIFIGEKKTSRLQAC